MENGVKWKEGVQMRSCVLRPFPIAHSIDAIHHLAEKLWLLYTCKEPIYQLHHSYNKTSWFPLWAASSVFLAVITVFSLGSKHRDATITSWSDFAVPSHQQGCTNSICLQEHTAATVGQTALGVQPQWCGSAHCRH